MELCIMLLECCSQERTYLQYYGLLGLRFCMINKELPEHLGIRMLNERLTDSTMQDSFESIFLKDNPTTTWFSINFFTSVGLGGITGNFREYLKIMPHLNIQQKPVSKFDEQSGSSGSSVSSASSSESESESSSPDSSEVANSIL